MNNKIDKLPGFPGEFGTRQGTSIFVSSNDESGLPSELLPLRLLRLDCSFQNDGAFGSSTGKSGGCSVGKPLL